MTGESDDEGREVGEGDGSPHPRGQREGRAVLGACFRNRLVFDGRDVGLAGPVEVGGSRIEAGRWLGPR